MAEEIGHIRTLIAARVRELEHRRNTGKELAKNYTRGHTENMREAFVEIQDTIEAIERAISHEEYVANQEAKSSSPVALGLSSARPEAGS